jgi:hypothetical protein
MCSPNARKGVAGCVGVGEHAGHLVVEKCRNGLGEGVATSHAMSVFDGLGRLDSSFSPRSAASQDSCKALRTRWCRL